MGALGGKKNVKIHSKKKGRKEKIKVGKSKKTCKNACFFHKNFSSY